MYCFLLGRCDLFVARREYLVKLKTGRECVLRCAESQLVEGFVTQLAWKNTESDPGLGG